MPLYEYECDKCWRVSSEIRPVQDRDRPLTCECGSQAKRIPSAPARPKDITWS